MSSDKVFKFVNEYLTVIAPAITNNQGFIDKFIGDAIMAIFASPEEATQASINMMERLEKYNQLRIQKGEEPINIGIGINTGQASMGTIGFANRLETTVIGGTVNVAARIEQLSKRYQVPVIISESTAADLDKSVFSLRYLDYVRVRGVKERVHIYELLNHLPTKEREAKAKMCSDYELAVQHYHDGDYDTAKRLLDKCQQIFPDDIAISRYIKRIKEDT